MNPQDIGYLAPTMPLGILVPVTLVLFIVLLFIAWRVRDRVAIFAMFAPWIRYVASAYHTFTFKPAFAGLSWNALGSAAVFVLGLLLIRWRNLLLRFLLPAYVSIALVVISGIANGTYTAILTVTVKYGYFIVVTLAVFEALERFGENFMSKLLWAFTAPLCLQVLSLVLGISKLTDDQGSISYIGGYDHEATFSVALATCFVVASFANNISSKVRNGILLLCLVGIFLANYRTTIIAIAPMMIAQFGFAAVRRFRRDQRMLIGMGAITLFFLGLVAASWLLRDRFQDLPAFLESGGMIKPPDEFSFADKKLMSGRSYIWSSYIYAYVDGSGLQQLIGFGPESWNGVFSVYAHNTLISHLYEYGVVGLIVIAYLFASMMFAAWRVTGGSRVKLLAAHLTFILLNMATMPLWMIEGNILYGIICGYTLYQLQGQPKHADQPAQQKRLARPQQRRLTPAVRR
jgi:hypothetical protein